ncbi:MAG: SulP family inorganic anion transporter [Phycisphaeraceae bacterium]|nr:SulP family inorganic anion transporter [Phycisphaeraceae bacterium]
MNGSLNPIALIRQSVLPAAATVRQYTLNKFGHDLLAGLTVSVLEIPQAMAYALIAGVPPQYGIYTSIIQGAIGALLSSSEHLATGPTNTQSLLIAAAVQRMMAAPGEPIYLQLVFTLTLLKGLIQLTFAFARMGNLVRYVSRSVILGVTSGAGVLIAIGQLPNALGIHLSKDMGESALPGVLGSLHELMWHLDQANPRAMAICVGGLAIILAGRMIWRFIPGPLLAVLGGAITVWLMGWTNAEVAQVGELPRSLPSFHVPQFTLEQAESLLAGALALALLGLIESVAIVKSIATHTGERIDPNQEFFAQGFKNTLTSFFQCIPGSGSFTRSALDFEAGGRTRFAAVFNALFVLTIYLSLSPAAGHIPLASLGAVLFVIAYGLIDWRYYFKALRSSRADGAVFLISFLATLLVPLEYAVFIGIFLNIALYLRRASQLHIHEMVRTPGGPFIERPLRDRGGDQPVMFLQMEGDLFFAVADELADRFQRIAHSGVCVVVIRLKRTHSIDATVLGEFERFTQQMQSRGHHVVLCGVKPELMQTLKSFGLVALIGPRNVFETGFGVFASAKRALQRARELLGRSIDADGLEALDETESWAYEI